MAEKKAENGQSDNEPKPQINFKCSAELKADIEDLAHLRKQKVSAMMIELCEIVISNFRKDIDNFRKLTSKPINFTLKSSKATKKKAVAQAADNPPDEGGGENENS